MKMALSNPEFDLNKGMDDSGCVQDEPMAEYSKRSPGLMDLSDDVLLCILRLCSPRDLKALGYTCPRLGTLICDRTLWTHVDARDYPTGKERMRWLLEHCLSSATQELKIRGYVNRETKCLGVQDLSYYGEFAGTDMLGDVDMSLGDPMGMWYPHLPRSAMSPRWPDKCEAEYRAKCLKRNRKPRLYPLTLLADKKFTDFIESVEKSDKEFEDSDIITANPSNLPSTSSSTASNTKDTSLNEQIVTKKSNPDETLNDSKSDLKPSNAESNSSACSSNPEKSDVAINSMSEDPISSNSASKSVNSVSNSNNTSPSPNNAASHQSQKTLHRDRSTSNLNISASSDYSSPKDDLEESAASKCRGPQFTFDEVILRKLRRKCCNLTSLALEYCNLDYRTTTLCLFPPALKKLSLRGTRCYNLPLNTSFLGKIQDKLPALEYLDISECEWFEPASLMSLSKLPSLEVLFMKECQRLTECVAYASLATRYGFQKLKVLDVRGSMVADSEVSAFGWLPVLEELYVSPPEDFKKTAEHSHKWEDVLVSISELEQWETDEPEYYKSKPSTDQADDEEDLKSEIISEEKFGNLIFDDYLNGPSLQSRIIVIQPNRNQDGEDEVRPEAARPPAAEPPLAVPPAAGPSIVRFSVAGASAKDLAPSAVLHPEHHLEPQASPSLDPQPGSLHAEPKHESPGPSKRSREDDVSIDLIKRPRLDNDDTSKKDRPNGAEDHDNSSSDDDDGSSRNRALERVLNLIKRSQSSDKSNSMQSQGIENAIGNENGPSSQNLPQNQIRPPNQNIPQEQNIPQNQNAYVRIRNGMPFAIQQPDDHQDPLRTLAFEISRAQARHEHPMVLPIPPNPYCVPEPLSYQAAMQQANLVQIEPYGNPQPNPVERSNDNSQQNDGSNRARPAGPRNPILAALIPRAAQPLVQINVDLQRESVSQTFPLFGYHLVTDSAVLRFGRADNETINYVHIGRFEPNERGVRPDRSSLRILSITGFRSITNRSLEHLATAAPHLRLIDFSNTGVTPVGVALFRVVRPDCEVIFSEFSRRM